MEKFSLLSKVAKIIICVKGASTATERDFSASGLVESVRSNSYTATEIASMAVLIQVSSKSSRLSASFRVLV